MTDQQKQKIEGAALSLRVAKRNCNEALSANRASHSAYIGAMEDLKVAERKFDEACSSITEP